MKITPEQVQQIATDIIGQTYSPDVSPEWSFNESELSKLAEKILALADISKEKISRSQTRKQISAKERHFLAVKRDSDHELALSINAQLSAAAPVVAQPVAQAAPTTKQLITQLHDGQTWSIGEQKAFAQVLQAFPNESSQGIISLGDAWKHGQAYGASISIGAAKQTCAEVAQKLRTYVGIYTGDKQARRLAEELENIALAAPDVPNPSIPAPKIDTSPAPVDSVRRHIGDDPTYKRMLWMVAIDWTRMDRQIALACYIERFMQSAAPIAPPAAAAAEQSELTDDEIKAIPNRIGLLTSHDSKYMRSLGTHGGLTVEDGILFARAVIAAAAAAPVSKQGGA